MNKWALYLALSIIPCLSFADEQTLSIIKPDAVKDKHIGDIIQRFESKGLKVGAMKMTQLTQEKAGAFYKEHEGRPFYADLTKFMTSGPVVVMVLSGPDAIAKNRELMGATDFTKAAPGTIRKDFAHSMTENAVHGSDSKESAKREIEFFFTPEEIVNVR